MKLAVLALLAIVTAAQAQKKPIVKPDLKALRPGVYTFDRIATPAQLHERSVLEIADAWTQLTISTGPSTDGGFAEEVYVATGRTGRFESDAGSVWWNCTQKTQEIHSKDMRFQCEKGSLKATSYDPRKLKGVSCVTSDQKALFWVPDGGVVAVAEAGACGEAQALRFVSRERVPVPLEPDLTGLARGAYSFQRVFCNAVPGTIDFQRWSLEVTDAGVRISTVSSGAKGDCGKGIPELVRFERGTTIIEADDNSGKFEWVDAAGVEGRAQWRCAASTEVVHSNDLALVFPPKPKTDKRKDPGCLVRLDMVTKSKTQKQLDGIRCVNSSNQLLFWAPDAGVVETVARDTPCGNGEAFRFAR